MEHQRQGTIFIHQHTIGPEAGAGKSGIKIKRNITIVIIQRDGFSLSIQQRAYPGEQSVSLTISRSAIGKKEDGITLQLQLATRQVEDRSLIGIINGQGVLAAQGEIIGGSGATTEQRVPGHSSQTG